jgi:hypothetical protein
MENEGQNAPPANAALAKAPNLFVPTPPAASGEVHRLLSEAMKYIIVLAFALYCIGFLIWHSYLAKYGVSSVAFLQMEYLSAAFCYLFILITFAVPPLLFIHAVKLNINALGLKRIGQWDRGLYWVICIWFYLTTRVMNIFLPFAGEITTWSLYSLLSLFGLVTLHLIAATFLAIMGGGLQRFVYGNTWQETPSARNWKQSNWHKAIVRSEYYSLYMLLFLILTLCFNPSVNGHFLFSSLFLYGSIAAAVGYNHSAQWNLSNVFMRGLIVVIACLVLISNIQIFARSQFDKIPKSVGGGRLEKAYVKFTQQAADIATLLNLQRVTNYSAERLTNGYVGPIAILLRSDKEIIFVDYAELSLSTHLTNVITNYSILLVTNKISVIVTNLSTNVLVRVTTNTATTYTTNILKNTVKASARQVSAAGGTNGSQIGRFGMDRGVFRTWHKKGRGIFPPARTFS